MGGLAAPKPHGGGVVQEMHADAVLAGLASARRGIVTYREMIDAGISRRQIERRIDSGHLIRQHQGIYAVGHEYLTPLARGEAALLAGGEGSMLADRFALALHQVLQFPATPSLIVPRGGPRPPACEVHQPRKLPPHTIKHGLRTTLLPRALLDLATLTDRAELTEAVNQAFVKGVTTEGLRREIRNGHRGTIALIAVVDGPHTRSPLEGRFLQLLRAGHLQPPDDVNVRINGHLVDFVWYRPRVIAETDGWGPHGGYGAFNRDRARDQDHTAARWRPIRITSQHVTKESHALIARLARIID